MLPKESINQFLSACFDGNNIEMLKLLDGFSKTEMIPLSLAMLRTAILQTGQSPLYYRQLTNLWLRLKRPALKPNPTHAGLIVISDATMNGAPGLLELFCAAFGVDLNVRLSEYDSVEQEVFSSDNRLNIRSTDSIVVILTDQWLRRYLCSTTMIEREKLIPLKNLLKNIFDALKQWGPAKIFMSNFPSRAFVGPGGSVVNTEYVGWSQAIIDLNNWLGTQVDKTLCIVDIAEAISLSGGSRALGRLSYLRARIPYEEMGMVSVCREIAGAVANILGKSHRALLTDWDNTLWGGEIGELGLAVNSSIDNADGLGYQLLQQYILDLRPLGVLTAAVSRNDPKVAKILDESSDILLKQSNFSSLQINWGAKSKSVSKVINDFNFGAEYMLFLDDSPVELTEVLSNHPYIDILLAGLTPDCTLTRLCHGRYFNCAVISEHDLERHNRQVILNHQKESALLFNSTQDFLRSLNIRLSVSDLTDENEMRVIQMLQKTNQFNLTTRRHQSNDIEILKEKGAKFGVFSYSDNFGHQGIISVVILLKGKDEILIDTWLMSCRVLNRGVENTVFSWMVAQADKQRLMAEYFLTQKNSLVRESLHQLGFQQMASKPNSKLERWFFNTRDMTTKACKNVQLLG